MKSLNTQYPTLNFHWNLIQEDSNLDIGYSVLDIGNSELHNLIKLERIL